MHRKAAQRYTRKAQMAAIALIAGAVGLAVLPVTLFGKAELPTETVRPTAPANVGGTVSVGAMLDADALGKDLKEIGPPVVVKPPEPVKPPDKDKDKDKEQPIVPPPAPEWRYLGAVIIENGPKFAFVSLNDDQKMVHEGDKMGDATVLEIQPDALKLQDDGKDPRTLERAPKAASLLQAKLSSTPATPTAPAPTPAPAAATPPPAASPATASPAVTPVRGGPLPPKPPAGMSAEDVRKANEDAEAAAQRRVQERDKRPPPVIANPPKPGAKAPASSK